MTLYEWECPDCGDITNGCDPKAICHCGQGNIVRNLDVEAAETEYEMEAKP